MMFGAVLISHLLSPPLPWTPGETRNEKRDSLAPQLGLQLGHVPRLALRQRLPEVVV
jgi:hypothetical protein